MRAAVHPASMCTYFAKRDFRGGCEKSLLPGLAAVYFFFVFLLFWRIQVAKSSSLIEPVVGSTDFQPAVQPLLQMQVKLFERRARRRRRKFPRAYFACEHRGKFELDEPVPYSSPPKTTVGVPCAMQFIGAS